MVAIIALLLTVSMIFTPLGVKAQNDTTSGSFGAGQGCSNCWSYSYQFPSDASVTLTLSLTDDQTCFLCSGGHPGVSINGGSNSITIYTSGPDSPGGQGCSVTWYTTGPPQSCPFTVNTSGSGSRSASVAVSFSETSAGSGWTYLIIVVNNVSKGSNPDWFGPYYNMAYSLSWFYLEDAIQAQAQVRLLQYQGLQTLINGFNSLSQQCLNAYNQYASGTSVPVEILGSYELESLFGALGIAAADFAWADVLSNCGSLQIVWNVANYGGDPGASLVNALGSMTGSVQAEVNDLSSYNVGYKSSTGALTDLANQAAYASSSGTNTIQYWDQQMINGLNGVIADNLYCFLPTGNVPCAPYAHDFINDVFQPLQNYVTQDLSYIQGVQQTLKSDASTLTATSPAPNAEVGVAYSSSMFSSGGLPPFNWVGLYSGSVPAGLSFTGGPASATISGTPTSAQSSPFTVQVTDGAGDTGYGYESINVYQHVAISTSSLPSGTATLPYSSSLSTTGGYGSDTWTLVSDQNSGLPPGLALSTGGTISGTPSQPGSYSFTVQVTDGLGVTAQEAFTLQINPIWSLAAPTASPISLGIACHNYRCINLGSSSTISDTIDYDGAGQSGVTLSFSASPSSGTSFSSNTCVTGSSGSCSVTFTITTAPSTTTYYAINVSAEGINKSVTVTYYLILPPPPP
jgi:hypothetical protein